VRLELTVRDLEPEDLGDLDWSGSTTHQQAVAEALQASFSGDVALLVVALANGRLVAMGGVDFRPSTGTRAEDAGELWMLSVHETMQGLGIGTLLIRSLEERIRERGRTVATLGVELDNPRAAALYRRLGYQQAGSALDGWPVDGGVSYVTVVNLLRRELEPAQAPAQ
jgi:ribosomal protein S18 acetylase RimI-like enzyme